MVKSILGAVWRSGGAVLVGALVAAALQTPLGLAAAPLLQGISKTVKKVYELRGGPVPAWVPWLPF